jgi:LysM repeat protein
VAWALVSAVGAFLVGPVSDAIQPHRPAPAAERRYVVQRGDTVWSVARRLAPRADPRALVDVIIASNHVDPGSLVAGQALVVPAGA